MRLRKPCRDAPKRERSLAEKGADIILVRLGLRAEEKKKKRRGREGLVRMECGWCPPRARAPPA